MRRSPHRMLQRPGSDIHRHEIEPLYAWRKLLPEMPGPTRKLGFAIRTAWPELLKWRTGRSDRGRVHEVAICFQIQYLIA